ncbi:hypothetical protein KBX71_08865 [Micromonospora sp. D93]|uniref:hypothetical protein n=1 Tax=Micromonospora sp. D93 TaxID=2824886 RepID=UPI001B37F88D|nr:hypothetical protein [Micromonospora sp. D93]MBQ1017975.1 hypothetical protein [Micromonospora sp. D93]
MTDPFQGLVDDAPADGTVLRAALLRDAKRGFSKLHKIFVQRPAGGERASMLAAMVRGRQERALDALLLLYALEPVLPGSPLPLSTWAKMLSSPRSQCSTQGASRAFDTLARHRLVVRRSLGRFVDVEPLSEDGSGEPWERPGRNLARVGKGYLTIPHDYWTTGLADRLALPGKAMFLIMLAETTQNQTFSMAVERAPQWYGISERTAERGYRELRQQRTAVGEPVLREHRQVVVDARSPTGLRPIWHRALSDPYSQTARARMQSRSARAVRTAAEAAEKNGAWPTVAMRATTSEASLTAGTERAG